MRALGVALVGLALAFAAPAPAEPGGKVWLRIEKPLPPHVRTSLPLLEVRGRAGARGVSGHDLVVAIDLSDSTLEPSGVDLDGDGPGGGTDVAFLAALAARPGVPATLLTRLAESDFEDSVLAAELAAARALLARIDPARIRVALVTFSDEARLVAPLGATRVELERALAQVARDFPRDLRGTNLAAAIELSLETLLAAPAPASASGALPRERTLLLLSDGAPTLPVRIDPAVAALEAAAVASWLGVRIQAFALGDEAEAALGVYTEIAAVSGGRMERVARPAEAIARLRRVDLAGLETVTVENLTTGEPARARRVFPDGSFDAFVPLAPGENRVRITAVASDGSRGQAERSVTRLMDEKPQPERLRALLHELRRRTREMALWAEIERGRFEARHELELRAVEGAGPGAD